MDPMTFKDVMAADINDAFLFAGEFAEVHVINGVEMTALVDDMEHIEREKKMKSTMDGIYNRQILIYVKAAEFGDLPAREDLVRLDGKTYQVADAVDEDGIYTITRSEEHTSELHHLVISEAADDKPKAG